MSNTKPPTNADIRKYDPVYADILEMDATALAEAAGAAEMALGIRTSEGDLKWSTLRWSAVLNGGNTDSIPDLDVFLLNAGISVATLVRGRLFGMSWRWIDAIEETPKVSMLFGEDAWFTLQREDESPLGWGPDAAWAVARALVRLHLDPEARRSWGHDNPALADDRVFWNGAEWRVASHAMVRADYDISGHDKTFRWFSANREFVASWKPPAAEMLDRLVAGKTWTPVKVAGVSTDGALILTSDSVTADLPPQFWMPFSTCDFEASGPGSVVRASFNGEAVAYIMPLRPFKVWLAVSDDGRAQTVRARSEADVLEEIGEAGWNITAAEGA